MRLYCESKNNDHREDIASLDFTSLSIRNRARIEYVILNLHVRQTLNISRGATTLLHLIIRWYKYADKYRPQMFYTYECLHCMNSRISMQIRQMQYDKPTRWVDSIQSISTPLRLGMTLPDPFCWDAHTLCCETSVLPMHTDICLPLLVSYSFSAPPPPPLFLWWGLLLHIHFNVHTSLQKSIAEPRYEGKPQQLAVYSCSL